MLRFSNKILNILKIKLWNNFENLKVGEVSAEAY